MSPQFDLLPSPVFRVPCTKDHSHKTPIDAHCAGANHSVVDFTYGDLKRGILRADTHWVNFTNTCLLPCTSTPIEPKPE